MGKSVRFSVEDDRGLELGLSMTVPRTLWSGLCDVLGVSGIGLWVLLPVAGLFVGRFSSRCK